MSDSPQFDKLMLPHNYERYSLFSIILRHQRVVLKKTQADIINKMKKNKEKHIIKQTTYSRKEKLGIFKKRRKNLTEEDRNQILTLLVYLSFTYEEICLLFWLLDGNDFQIPPFEKMKYFSGTHNLEYGNEIKNNSWFAHKEVVDSLRERLKNTFPPSRRQIEIKAMHGIEESDFVKNEERLFNLEKGDGHRLYMGKYPSILLTRDTSEIADMYIKHNALCRSKFKNILENRIEKFKKNIELFGARCIHSIDSLRNFVKPGIFDELYRTERIGRIESLIELLENDNFHIALADSEPEWEIMIKSFECVALRPTSSRIKLEKSPLFFGPTLLYWQNEPFKHNDKTQSEVFGQNAVNNKLKSKKDGAEEGINTNLWNVLASYIDFESVWIPLYESGKADRDYVVSELLKLYPNKKTYKST